MLTGDLRPRHFVAIALIVLLSVVGAACGASAGTQTSTSTQAPASGVPLAQVLAAVKSAETTTRLPSTITRKDGALSPSFCEDASSRPVASSISSRLLSLNGPERNS